MIPRFGPYMMTKEAMRGLQPGGGPQSGVATNIRVNELCPAALTPSAAQFRDAHPEAFGQMLKTVPLGRMGDGADDIASDVAALVSDGLRYLTGATLMLDGGRLMFP